MAKKQKQPAKTCVDCIHEYACRMWTNGRAISDESASRCPNHETVKESGAYLCGALDERKRKRTTGDRFRAMSDEELTDLAFKLNIDEQVNFCKMLLECRGILDRNEALDLDKCKGCFMDWLKQPYEEGEQDD